MSSSPLSVVFIWENGAEKEIKYPNRPHGFRVDGKRAVDIRITGKADDEMKLEWLYKDVLMRLHPKCDIQEILRRNYGV